MSGWTDALGRACLSRDRYEGVLACSACGSDFPDDGSAEDWRFCPACGVKLSGVDEEPRECDEDMWKEEPWLNPARRWTE